MQEPGALTKWSDIWMPVNLSDFLFFIILPGDDLQADVTINYDTGSGPPAP
jgi:hypothetical protein